MLRKLFLSILTLAVLSLCACAHNLDEMLESQDDEPAAILGISGYIPTNYTLERPKNPPLPIYVNQIGFRTESEKILIFSKDIEKDTAFEIINAKTKKIAYKGSVNKAAPDGIGYANFGGLKTEGTYYARVRSVGESKTFEIKNDVYEETLHLLGLQHGKARQSLFETKKDGGENSIEWDSLFVLQELLFLEVDKARAINALYENDAPDAALLQISKRLTANLLELTKDYPDRLFITGLICRLSQYFKTTDEALAKDLSQKALELGEGLISKEAADYNNKEYIAYEYFAYTALFSLMGDERFHAKIKEKAKAFEEDKNLYKDDGALKLWRLLGDYNYLNARFKTDEGFSETIILQWQGEVSAILGSTTHIQEHLESHDSVFALIDSVYLFLMDYILSGNEYEHIQVQIADFYAGRNSRLLNMADSEEQRASFLWENSVYKFVMN